MTWVQDSYGTYKCYRPKSGPQDQWASRVVGYVSLVRSTGRWCAMLGQEGSKGPLNVNDMQEFGSLADAKQYVERNASVQ